MIDPETRCLVVSSTAEFIRSFTRCRPTVQLCRTSLREPQPCGSSLGVLSDGAAGSAMIAREDGRVLAQSASEALFADMPNAAMRRSQVGLAFDSTSLAQVVCNLMMVPGVAAWFGIGKAGVGATLLSTTESSAYPWQLIRDSQPRC